MKALHFNFKDVFRAPRLAFSIQRIWMNGIGFLGGYLVYLVFAYASLMTAGYSFSYLWSYFGVLPCAFAVSVPWFSMIIYLAGLAGFLAVILMTNTAVSRAIYMTLRDELFYTWTQAYKFAIKKWISALGAMLTFIFIIAFFVIAALVMGLLGRIPWVGELGTALLTVPYIFASLLLFFIGVAFVVAVFFVPAIIATSDEDALGGVFQSFSITFNQLWRILLYGSLLSVLYLAGLFLFAAALKISYHIFMGIFSIGMGDKITQIEQQALYIIDQSLPAMYGWFQMLPGKIHTWVYLAHPHPSVAELPGSLVASGYILGIFLLFFGGIVLVYGEAIFNAGLTVIYIILYKLQEKENLLEREDEELREEDEEEEKITEAEEPAAAKKVISKKKSPGPRKTPATPRKPRKKS